MAGRAVVTGGAGFIGSHLCERLVAEGHRVLVVDNLVAGSQRLGFLEALGIPIERLDVRDPAAGELIHSFRPDVVFHLAAQIDVRRSVADPVYDAQVNVVGTLRVLEAAARTGARVLFASSGGTIYGEVDPRMLPVTEDASGRPTSPYGINKRVSEDYLRFYRDTGGLAFVSLALANVYGPRQDPHGEAGVVAIFSMRLLRGEPCVIYGDGAQSRDFVYVGDVVEAFLAAVGRGEGETVNIGTGVETSVLELYRAMAGLCALDRPPLHAPGRPGELRRSCLDVSKAHRVLGWKPATGLQEGLALTIDSFRGASSPSTG
ncbi:MAG: NAD-dependent epimerase/dehydratase family protein [Actinomycetota bacterium]